MAAPEERDAMRGLHVQDRLTRFNWYSWLVLVRPLLQAKGLAAFVPSLFGAAAAEDGAAASAAAAAASASSSGKKKDEKKEAKGDAAREAQAYYLLMESASAEIRLSARKEKSADDVFKAFKARCEPTPTAAWQAYAAQTLAAVAARPGERMETFIARLVEALDVYEAAYGVPAPEATRVQRLFDGVARVNAAWARFAEVTQRMRLSFDEACDVVREEEMKLVTAGMQQQGSTTGVEAASGTAAAAGATRVERRGHGDHEHRREKREGGNGARDGGGAPSGETRGGGASDMPLEGWRRGRRPLRCYGCGVLGYRKDNCPICDDGGSEGKNGSDSEAERKRKLAKAKELAANVYEAVASDDDYPGGVWPGAETQSTTY
jgi:hypothetical protein